LKQINLMDELIIDNFAGGGGASTGIELALGRPVDVAINHDPDAILMHKTNHPYTHHYCEDIWSVDPREVTKGRPVALCWLSPDCKHFSKAKGGKPVDKNIRGLAWVAVRWAATVRPRVIILENVEEFKTWGPVKDGQPDINQKGRTFNSFVNALKRQGYEVDWRELRACDYGAPTIRKRFFLVARCDGKPITWPEPTHGEGLIPYRTAAEIIDWSYPMQSIFGRQRPLSESTMNRIAKGLKKFVIDNPNPYIVDSDKAAYLIQYHSETTRNEARGQNLTEPIMTVDSSNRYGLVAAFISRQFGTSTGHEMTHPLGTVTAVDKSRLVAAYLTTYYGNKDDIGQPLDEPLRTITSKDRFGLVTVKGINYQITDIAMRMLQPRELYNAQGFPADYIIDHDYTGKTYPKSKQVARCGNAVPPPFAEALVRANLPEMASRRKIETMADLEDEIAV
jgi:DNA (cytosine-5)-methyltransferase 1